MPDHDQTAPREPDDAADVELGELLEGPSPRNRVHGAIELGAASAAPRPSDESVEAARTDIFAALWGPSW